MRKTSFLLIICLILESCSLNFKDFGRAPSSEERYADLISKFSNFKIKINGSEKDRNCSKEQLDRDFEKLISSMKEDSCKENKFSVDKNEFTERVCPKIKIDGAIGIVAKKIINEEKSKKPITNFSNANDVVLNNLYKEALVYKQAVNTILSNDNIDTEERIQVVNNYVENVLLPFRDLITIKKMYQPINKDGSEYIPTLLPLLTDSFVKNLSNDQKNLVTQGPNSTSTPFYMELVESNNPDFYLLQFNPNQIMRRDVIALLKAPTAKNYVLALKWMTLHMMLSQMYLYNTILENKSPVPIPKSCQNHFNGSLPPQFKFNFEDGDGDQYLEGLIAGHGLMFNPDDANFLDYYIDNINKDPLKDGYSGMVPFENYKNASKGLMDNEYNALDAQFDDVAHFQTVLNVKLNEAYDVFKDTAKAKRNNLKEEYNITYAGIETFQQILATFQPDEIAEYKLKDGTVAQIYPGKQNLSQYLLELMKKNGLSDYSQLLTPKLKKKFEGKRVYIDMPSMYSSPVWRDWSLKVLADLFHQYRNVPTNSQLHQIVNSSCNPGNYIGIKDFTALRQVCAAGNRVQLFDDFLAEFRSGETYIPTRRLEERKFQSVYPALSFIWKNVRDKTDLLLEAKPFELNFLLDQMTAGNPWARLKLSYMVALDQLEYQKDGLNPGYEFNGLWYTMDQKTKCDTSILDLQYQKIKKAGRILGLEIPLTYNFTDKILSKKEKNQAWNSVLDEFEQKNAQLFSVKRNNKTYYQSLEDVSFKTILSESQALNTGINLSKDAKNDIKKVSDSVEANLSEFFLRLYSLKGQRDKQYELYEKFSKVNGIDNSYKVKLGFLALDNSYKVPIYKELIKQAALTRKYQIQDQLNTFCEMDINNPKEFKKIFYSTTKAQNDLNQLAGLPAIPSEVMEKLSEMSPDESRDMWWGIGSGVMGIAAIVVGGACTGLSGGICAPLGGAMAAAGLASIGIQTKLTTNEFERKLEANEAERDVQKMEELGFAKLGSHDEVHRTLAWTAVEAMSIFPLIGIASKSVALGPKLVVASTQSIMRQTGKTAFKAAAKTTAEQEEVRLAKYVLGIDSMTKNVGLDSKTLDIASKKIAKIKQLYQMGEIDLDEMLKQMAKVLDPIKKAKLAIKKTMKAEFGSVVLKESKEQIDAQTAKVVSTYFNNNPKTMLRLIGSYSGERLNRAVRAMAEMNNPKKIGNKIPIYRGVKNWFVRMRNESLANNAAKILRIEKELQTLPQNSKAFNNFITKNMDDLTDIFMDIPMRKRELPYIIQVQGMPMFNVMGGRKIPILSMMSEGQTMKKIFSARARLVYETYKMNARKNLKLGHFIKSETTFVTFSSFQNAIADLASRKTGEESSKILVQYEKLEEELAQKLFKTYTEKGNRLEYDTFKKLVLRPQSLKEKAVAEAIWESVPADELMKMKEVNEVAHKAVEELSHYDSIDEFESYLSALKVLIINRSPVVLDMM